HLSLITHHCFLMSSLATAHAPEQIVRDLIADVRVERACLFFTEHAAEITEEHIGICAIPAPPFGETARAEYLAARLRQCGLTETEVGEEGEGNLRGVRHLLTVGRWAREVDAFLSLDGPGVERITNTALGSRRYRVRFTGTGGHSWGDFGAANPVHALGRTIARLAAYPAPTSPRTTFNVGRISGGTGVNVIAQAATMD